MQKRISSIPRLLIVLLLFLAFALLWASASPYQRFWIRQQQLASDLGVKISDYPMPATFPVEYFRARLRQGMPAGQVHEIVRGYESVYWCSIRSEEIYYYFSAEDTRALRLAITYDGNLNFDSLATEDAQQRTISTEGCAPGRLGE